MQTLSRSGSQSHLRSHPPSAGAWNSTLLPGDTTEWKPSCVTLSTEDIVKPSSPNMCYGSFYNLTSMFTALKTNSTMRLIRLDYWTIARLCVNIWTSVGYWVGLSRVLVALLSIMPSRQKQIIFSVAGVLCFGCVLVVAAAMGTQFWVKATVLCKTGAQIVNATGPELKKFIGRANYGLFHGQGMKQCGLGDRPFYFSCESLYKSLKWIILLITLHLLFNPAIYKFMVLL